MFFGCIYCSSNAQFIIYDLKVADGIKLSNGGDVQYIPPNGNLISLFVVVLTRQYKDGG